MTDNSTSVSHSNLTTPSPSNFTSTSPNDYFKITGGWWFYVVSGLIDHTLGIPANGWTLYVILTSGGRRRSLVESDIITLNLVAMEISSSLSFILVLINQCFIQSMSMARGLNFNFGLALSGRSLFQCLICLERYLAVVHPVLFLRYKPPRYRLACCGLVWLLALGFGGLNVFLGFSQMNSTISLVLALFILVLSVDLFCSLSILRVLKQPRPGDGGRERGRETDGGKEEDREADGGRERGKEKKDGGMEEEQKAGAGERGKVKEGERAAERGKERLKEEQKDQQKRRAFRIVSFMLGMLVFNHVPLIICLPLQVLGLEVFYNKVFLFALSFSQMGTCVQALLYLHRAGKLPCLTPTTMGRQQNN